jgi:hypothetical protein
MHGTVPRFKFSHFSVWQLKTTPYNLKSLSDEYVRRPPKGLLCNRVRSYKLIMAYHVYYDYYEIDRNKQSKITVHETDT